MDVLSKAVPVSILIFVVSSMLAMGSGLTVAQIIEPLRNVRLVVLTLLANFALMPLAAVALVKVLRIDEQLGYGLLLLGCTAGAPLLPKLASVCQGQCGICSWRNGSVDGAYSRLPPYRSAAAASRSYR
jgi:BASS family bile acid:Na+ symporter